MFVYQIFRFVHLNDSFRTWIRFLTEAAVSKAKPYRFIHIRQVSTICYMVSESERLSPVRSVTSEVSSFAQLSCFYMRDLLVPGVFWVGWLELKVTGGKCSCRSMVCCTFALYSAKYSIIAGNQQIIGFPPNRWAKVPPRSPKNKNCWLNLKKCLDHISL